MSIHHIIGKATALKEQRSQIRPQGGGEGPVGAQSFQGHMEYEKHSMPKEEEGVKKGKQKLGEINRHPCHPGMLSLPLHPQNSLSLHVLQKLSSHTPAALNASTHTS